MIAALERLKTPRDAAYEMEIQRISDKYQRLEKEYNATRELLSQMEDTLSKSLDPKFIDLGNIVRTEIIHIKSIRENYEIALEKNASESSQ